MIDFSHFWDEVVKWFHNLFKKKKITRIDFTLEPQETRVRKGEKMADFTLTVGTHKTLVPKAFKGGQPVGFPEGTVFAWTVSDPNFEFSDPSAASPELTAIGEAVEATIELVVQEGGNTHKKTHTVDAVAAPVDPIDEVDFELV